MLKNKKINITFFSANRAEYGLIYPFIKKISNNKKFNVNLIVAGSHLEKKFGNTVRLGKGNANFKQLFKNLRKINYKGNLIFQTARSKINKHLEEMKINMKFIRKIQNEI